MIFIDVIWKVLQKVLKGKKNGMERTGKETTQRENREEK